MGADPLNDGRIVDHGDELHPPGAARTAFNAAVRGFRGEHLPTSGRRQHVTRP